MDNQLYIKVGSIFWFVQAIPESVTGDTVTVTIKRLSDGYTWNFSTTQFVLGSQSGNMTFISDILWKQSFTPPTEDTYIVTVTDSTLDVKYIQVLKASGTIEPVTASAPSASQVSIINLGLSHIAQKPIVAITDLSPQALAAMRVWDSSLRDALRAAIPPWATAVIALALHATYIPLHWFYAYMYPANCLAMNLVYNEGTIDPTIGEQFRELYHPTTNEKVIVTNCELAYGEYTYLIADTTLFDSSFVTVLGYKLGANLAVPLVGDRTLAESLDKKFMVVASECARLNSYEKNVKTKQTSVFLTAR